MVCLADWENSEKWTSELASVCSDR